jgi:hypothetical protein
MSRRNRASEESHAQEYNAQIDKSTNRRIPMSEFLEALKPGDAVIVKHGPKSTELLRKVARRTPTQIMLNNATRFRITGGRIGGSGYIERLATQDDLDREEEKVRKRQESDAVLKADFERRQELEGLFPEGWAARLSSGLVGSGSFELSFYNVSETQIRSLAKLLSKEHSMLEDNTVGKQ